MFFCIKKNGRFPEWNPPANYTRLKDYNEPITFIICSPMPIR